MKDKDEFLFQATRFLSQDVGVKIPFLKKTACMGKEGRELIAFCEMYVILFPEDKDFVKFLKKKAIPSLALLGHADWKRDVLTDLGLSIAQRRTSVTWGKDGDDNEP